jgi:hypothetical protein
MRPPFLEGPTAERDRRDRRNRALRDDRRSISEDRTLSALVPPRDLLADPSAEQLPDHR